MTEANVPKQQVNTNLLGTIFMSRAVLKSMLRNSGVFMRADMCSCSHHRILGNLGVLALKSLQKDVCNPLTRLVFAFAILITKCRLPCTEYISCFTEHMPRGRYMHVPCSIETRGSISQRKVRIDYL